MPLIAVLRPLWWSRWLATGALAMLAAMLVGLIAAGGWGWLGLPVGVACAVLAVRTGRLRVEVRGDGLVVANHVRTHHLHWSAVARAGCDGGVWIRLRSGGEIRVAALAEPPSGTLPPVRTVLVRHNERGVRILKGHIDRHRRR